MRPIQALAVLALAIFSLAGCTTPAPGPASRPAQPACPDCSPCLACPDCPSPVATPSAAQQPFARTLRPAEWRELPGWNEDDIASAWPAFLLSCRGMAGRPWGADWKRVCDKARDAAAQPGFDARAFFQENLSPYAIIAADGDVNGTITGYYEPLLRGSRQRTREFGQPVLGVPDDLLNIDLSVLFPELKDKRVRGRLDGKRVVPYWTRAEINDRGETLPASTLLYVDDPVELFFLQVQGSGRVRLGDGSTVRLNYADQNGHPYQSIGRLLVARGELKLEDASMQGIQSWARANPARLDELLNANPSYVFFREMPDGDDGPLGALGVPLTAERAIAVDPRSVPLGAPVFLSTTQPNSSQPLNRLVMAQDTGGAIKGAVRADFFWGFGKTAGGLAGRMKQSGRMWLLLPNEATPR